MNFRAPLLALAMVATASAQVPKIFSGLFEKDVPVKAQIGLVMPPPEIDKFRVKVEAAARKDPQWFREFSSNSKQDAPLPYNPRLGLTQEEYTTYLKLWNQREFKGAEDITLMLREPTPGSWCLTATGSAFSLSTLRYSAKDDLFLSPNGKMKRLPDIKAEASSILGAWSGAEWKYEEATDFGKTKENLAIGRFADNKHGLVVYRLQEISSEGTRLLDKSLVIRFQTGKPAAPAAARKSPAKK
ncbi:MAG: hypothetical protein QM627_07405 [Luteolibacter sp.]